MNSGLAKAFLHIVFTIIFSGGVTYLFEPSGTSPDAAYITVSRGPQEQVQPADAVKDKDEDKKLFALRAE